MQNEKNVLYQRDVIHSLICDKDRICLIPGRFFSPKDFPHPLPVFSSTFLSVVTLRTVRAKIFFFLNDSAAAICIVSFDLASS